MAAAKRKRPAKAFYASVVDDTAALIEANEIEGVDEELALVRVRLLEAMFRNRDGCVRAGPDRPEAAACDDKTQYELMLKSVELIARMVASRYRMSPRRKQDLVDHIAGTLRALGDQFLPQAGGDL